MIKFKECLFQVLVKYYKSSYRDYKSSPCLLYETFSFGKLSLIQ